MQKFKDSISPIFHEDLLPVVFSSPAVRFQVKPSFDFVRMNPRFMFLISLIPLINFSDFFQLWGDEDLEETSQVRASYICFRFSFEWSLVILWVYTIWSVVLFWFAGLSFWLFLSGVKSSWRQKQILLRWFFSTISMFMCLNCLVTDCWLLIDNVCVWCLT